MRPEERTRFQVEGGLHLAAQSLSLGFRKKLLQDFAAVFDLSHSALRSALAISVLMPHFSLFVQIIRPLRAAYITLARRAPLWGRAKGPIGSKLARRLESNICRTLLFSVEPLLYMDLCLVRKGSALRLDSMSPARMSIYRLAAVGLPAQVFFHFN